VPFMVAGGLGRYGSSAPPSDSRLAAFCGEARKRCRKQEGGGQSAPLQACRVRGGVQRQESPELLLGRSTAAPLMAKVAAHRR
jgi:hypothetical protein